MGGLKDQWGSKIGYEISERLEAECSYPVLELIAHAVQE